MVSIGDNEDENRVRQAAEYIVAQHGAKAAEEIEAAIRNAVELNDKSTIETLTDVLAYLNIPRT